MDVKERRQFDTKHGGGRVNGADTPQAHLPEASAAPAADEQPNGVVGGGRRVGV